MRPIGSNKTWILAGAMGERGSSILTFGEAILGEAYSVYRESMAELSKTRIGEVCTRCAYFFFPGLIGQVLIELIFICRSTHRQKSSREQRASTHACNAELGG